MLSESKDVCGLSFSRKAAGGVWSSMVGGRHVTLHPVRKPEGGFSWTLRIDHYSPTHPPKKYDSPEEAVKDNMVYLK